MERNDCRDCLGRGGWLGSANLSQRHPALKTTPASPHWTGTIGTFIVGGLSVGGVFAARLVIPMVALSLGASTLLVGVIAAMFPAVPMLLSVQFGRWVDRVGTLRPAMAAAALMLIIPVLYAVWPTPYVLPLVAGLAGAGAVFAHIVATRAIGEAVEARRRATYLGHLVLVYSFFQFICPLVAGAAYQYLGGTVALATIGLFAALSIATLGTGQHFYRTQRELRSSEVSKQPFYQLLGNKQLRTWVLFCSIFSAAQTLFPFVVSLYAMQIGLSAVQASSMVGAFALGSLLSRLSIGVLMRCFTARTLLKMTLVLGALLYAMIPLVRDVQVLYGLSGLLAIPLAIGVPVGLAMIYEAAPQGRVNECVGLSMSLNSLLQTVLPLIMGLSAAQFGIAPMVWVFAASMVLGASMRT
ncbi:MFS transporter [Pseudomonas pudica]|uniref:MFS transporter n=1 Tax=Pseudomonas pudica TaxID=272772 RepID=UPI003207CDB0